MPFNIEQRKRQMEMDPRFQRATYARQMTDPRQWATPNVGDVVRGYAGERAQAEEYGAGRGAQIAMRGKEAATGVGLREKELAFGEKRLALTKQIRTDQIAASRRDLDYQRNLQDIMEQQNRMATGFAIADVGLNVLGGYVNIQEAKRQEKLMAEQEDYFRKASTMLETFIAEIEEKKARKRGRPY